MRVRRSLVCALGLIACSPLACTKRQTVVGASVGVAMMVAGAITVNQSSDMGLGLFGFFVGVGGGGVVVGGSLIGGLIGSLDRSSSDSKPPRNQAADDRRCVPVSPTSSGWTCGEGYACTEDFEGCEPAVGAPIRHR